MSHAVQRKLSRGTLVPILVVLQALMVYSIWSLGAVGEDTDELFALYLAIDLVAFSMTSYLYRVDYYNRGLILGGAIIMMALIFVVVLGLA